MTVPQGEESPTVTADPAATAGGPASASPPVTGPTTVADHWGIVLALGVVTIGLGTALAIWPKASVTVLAVLVALQLMASGLVSLVSAVGSRTLDRGARTLVGLSGILAVLLSLVLLRAPQQTLVAVSLLVGLWWVFKGLVDIVSTLAHELQTGEPWLWNATRGALTAVVGAVVVLNPKMSFGLLLVIVQVWLIGYGFLTIVTALGMRSARQGAATA